MVYCAKNRQNLCLLPKSDQCTHHKGYPICFSEKRETSFIGIGSANFCERDSGIDNTRVRELMVENRKLG